MYLRHVDTPVATTAVGAAISPSAPPSGPAASPAVSTGANGTADATSAIAATHSIAEHDSAPVNTAHAVATGTHGDLQRLVAEVPCGLHHSAIMPSLGQGFAVFCMHMSRVPVVLLCVVPTEPSPVVPEVSAMEGDCTPHALHDDHTPAAHMHAAAAELDAAVPQPQATLDDPKRDTGMRVADCGDANGDGGGANAWGACIHVQEGDMSADCELTVAIAELIQFKRNKYVQKKSPQAWRIEPHLPREIAGVQHFSFWLNCYAFCT